MRWFLTVSRLFLYLKRFFVYSAVVQKTNVVLLGEKSIAFNAIFVVFSDDGLNCLYCSKCLKYLILISGDSEKEGDDGSTTRTRTDDTKTSIQLFMLDTFYS